VNLKRQSKNSPYTQAQFMRTYYPDVDISFELLKDELRLDEEEAMNSVLDPYAGNRLAYFCMETKQKQLTPFVAFACGVTGSELSKYRYRLTIFNCQAKFLRVSQTYQHFVWIRTIKLFSVLLRHL
jgi:hypothetical protein